MAVMISILLSNFINFITVKIDGECSWRVSLGPVAFPPMFMMAGTLVLLNTSSSLIERGHTDAVKRTLQKVHGSLNVEQEFQDLLYASYFLNRVEYPWKHILLPRYRPQLVICILVPMFQQLTGINTITFYAPVLLRSQEFGSDCSPKAGVITRTVNILATFVVIISVHRFGRRVLFLAGGMLMMVCQIGTGAIIALQFGFTGEGSLTKTKGRLMLILICSYMSYGLGDALGWFVPGEISPLEARRTAQAISVLVNMLFTFITAQGYISMLSYMKFANFFFALLLAIMALLVFLFMLETNNVPLKEMSMVLKLHWFWGQYIPDKVIFEELESRYTYRIDK